jgi:hypothetical protein
LLKGTINVAKSDDSVCLVAERLSDLCVLVLTLP